MKFDLGFGRADCVRDALVSEGLMPSKVNQHKLDYPTDDVIEELVDLTKQLCITLYGNSLDRVCIVNGAMNGLDLLTRVTNPDMIFINHNHFAYYESLGDRSLIRKCDFTNTSPISTNLCDLTIVDSPNNPTGKFLQPNILGRGTIAWDAVYHNPVYCNVFNPHKGSDFTIGSFGKLFGISGIRLGFVATNHQTIADSIDEMVEKNQCGLNSVSIDIATAILKQDLSHFYTKARYNIDSNRSEFAKLSYLLGELPATNGMFYYPKVDGKIRKLLNKSNILFIEGEHTGDPSRIRLNMCADREMTKKAIKNILKNDRRK